MERTVIAAEDGTVTTALAVTSVLGVLNCPDYALHTSTSLKKHRVRKSRPE